MAPVSGQRAAVCTEGANLPTLFRLHALPAHSAYASCARFLCVHRRGSSADSSRRSHGGGVSIRKTPLPSHGSDQCGGHLRVSDSRRAAFGNHRCEFSLVIFRGGHDWSDCRSVHRAIERALPARTRSPVRRDPRCIALAARDSIPNGNARRGRMDFRAPASICRALWIRPAGADPFAPLSISGRSFSFPRSFSSECFLRSPTIFIASPWQDRSPMFRRSC